MATDKRPLSPDRDGGVSDLALVKRQKLDGQLVVGSITKDGVKRTSNLQAPTMQLSGHAGEVTALSFSPDGTVLASGSYDRTILFWRTFGECENYMMVRGHKNVVCEVHWFSSGDALVSCSADKSVRCWDAHSGEQVKRLREHTAVVNSCSPLRRGPQLIVSGADDGVIKVWDFRSKRSVQTLSSKYPILAVAFSEAGDQVYAGGIEQDVLVYDLRKGVEAMRLAGHRDTVTGLAVCPSGDHLLTNSMDGTLRMWDMRPYAPANRCQKVFTGLQHSFERHLLRCCWSPDSSRISAGSADRNVHIWDVATLQQQYVLPGHKGSVNEVRFHPTEPIVASGSSDRTIFLGELAEL